MDLVADGKERKVKKAASAFLVALSLQACVSDTTPRAVSTEAIQPSEVGRIAAFSAPTNCQMLDAQRWRKGSTTSVRSGCVVEAQSYVTIFGLSEITVPVGDAFSVSGDVAGFTTAAAAFPREVLLDYVRNRERDALSVQEPGMSYSKVRSSVLTGNGGVEGADVCVRFSFNAISADPSRRDGTVSGVRCARLDPNTATVEEAMLEVMAFFPNGSAPPANFEGLANQAISSLRYR